jgi:putative transposon-encoded protein
MRKIPFNPMNEFTVKNIKGYFERNVTKFGTGAKVDVPKEHLGKRVVILVCED